MPDQAERTWWNGMRGVPFGAPGKRRLQPPGSSRSYHENFDFTWVVFVADT